MGFVLIGCVLVVVKLAGIGPVAGWSWWLVLSPFAAAAIWWVIADVTGNTQRQSMDRERKRVEDRRLRHLKAMGLDLFDRKHARRPPPDRPPGPPA